MNKTTYEQLLQQKEQQRRTKLSSLTVIHELVKHMDAESMVTALRVTQKSLSDGELAVKLSEDLGVSLQDLAAIHEKTGLCLRFTS